MIETLFDPDISQVSIRLKSDVIDVEGVLLNLLLHCIGHVLSENTFRISEITNSVLSEALHAFHKTGLVVDIINEHQDFHKSSYVWPEILWIPSVKKKVRFGYKFPSA